MQIPSNILLPGNQSTGASNQDRAPRPDAAQRIESPTKEPESVLIDPQALIKKGELRELDRLRSAAALEKTDFKTQQAITEYQNTYAASEEFEGGVLVGIDLYI